jgi:CBS domain-containing protein
LDHPYPFRRRGGVGGTLLVDSGREELLDQGTPSVSPQGGELSNPGTPREWRTVTEIREIMQQDVVTVTPDTSVRELLRILAESQISGVPVVGGSGEIVGVVSTTDVIRLSVEESELSEGSLGLEGLPPLPEDVGEDGNGAFFYTGEVTFPRVPVETDIPEGLFDGFTVADIMTSAAFTVTPRDDVQQVARFLLQGRIHRALVVDSNRLQGIVTTFDLLRAMVGEEGDG